MARKEVTIPAAGEFITVKLTGRSILVEQMNKYSEAAQVPTMDLINGISDYPLYNLSTYPNDEQFNSIKIYGTAESAGDTIQLLSTNACLDLDIKVAFAGQYEAEPGTTQEEVINDSVFQFTELGIINAEGKLPSAIYLAANGSEPVRYAFNVDPEQSGTGNLGYELGIPGANKRNEPIKIEGIEYILALRFINKTATQAASLIYTFEY